MMIQECSRRSSLLLLVCSIGEVEGWSGSGIRGGGAV